MVPAGAQGVPLPHCPAFGGPCLQEPIPLGMPQARAEQDPLESNRRLLALPCPRSDPSSGLPGLLLPPVAEHEGWKGESLGLSRAFPSPPHPSPTYRPRHFQSKQSPCPSPPAQYLPLPLSSKYVSQPWAKLSASPTSLPRRLQKQH